MSRLPSLLWVFLLSTGAWAYSSNDYYVAGLDFYTHKDYAKSISYLQQAVKLDPQNWQAYQILGYDYYLSKQPAQALANFDLSLRLHSDNPPLWKLAEPIRAQLIWEAERNDIYPRVFRNYSIWVGLHPGLLTGSLGDLPKSVAAYQNYYGSLNGHASASADGFGPALGLEVGFMMDNYNAWGVVFDGAALNGFKGSTNDNFGNSSTETLQPNMVSIQAEYLRFFKLGRFRLCAEAGAGVYNTAVELNVIDQNSAGNSVTFQSGEMGGIGWGGFLGLGLETALGGQFSAGLFARGRFATTGNIQGIITDQYGDGQMSALVADSSGLVSAQAVNNTGGYKAVNIDYTGADLELSFSYHY